MNKQPYQKDNKPTIEFSNASFSFVGRHGCCSININLHLNASSQQKHSGKYGSCIKEKKRPTRSHYHKTGHRKISTLYIRILSSPRAPARLQSVHCTRKRSKCAAGLYDIRIWRHAPSHSLGKSDALNLIAQD